MYKKNSMLTPLSSIFLTYTVKYPLHLANKKCCRSIMVQSYFENVTCHIKYILKYTYT